MSAPWTEAHRREALRRTYELCAELADKDAGSSSAWLAEGAAGWAANEGLWRSELGDHFDDARVDREVRRVRALAEGRLVREQSERWHVRILDEGGAHTMTESEARAEARGVTNPAHVARVFRVRVTRIRIRRSTT